MIDEIKRAFPPIIIIIYSSSIHRHIREIMMFLSYFLPSFYLLPILLYYPSFQCCCQAFIIGVRHHAKLHEDLSLYAEPSVTFPTMNDNVQVRGLDIIDHVCMLDDSLKKLTGSGVSERMGVSIYVNEDGSRSKEAIFNNLCLNNRYVLISHGTEDDPIYNFSNIAGLEAFHRTWEEVRKIPSRESVVLQSSDEKIRISLMKNVTANGFVEGATGIRVRGDGQFIRLVDAVVSTVFVEPKWQ